MLSVGPVLLQESEGAPKLPGAGAEEEDDKAGDEPAKAKQKDSGMWKRRNAKARVRREYKTAEEVRARSRWLQLLALQPRSQTTVL